MRSAPTIRWAKSWHTPRRCANTCGQRRVDLGAVRCRRRSRRGCGASARAPPRPPAGPGGRRAPRSRAAPPAAARRARAWRIPPRAGTARAPRSAGARPRASQAGDGAGSQAGEARLHAHAAGGAHAQSVVRQRQAEVALRIAHGVAAVAALRRARARCRRSKASSCWCGVVQRLQVRQVVRQRHRRRVVVARLVDDLEHACVTAAGPGRGRSVK